MFNYLLTNRFLSAIIVKQNHGRLAQLGEHLPYKQRVTGSSPVLSTKDKYRMQRLRQEQSGSK